MKTATFFTNGHTMDFTDVDLKDLQLADAVEAAADLVDAELNLESLTERLHQIAASIRGDRFRVVVVGCFSRGKSTLLNAMLGCDILPQKMAPATAVVTELEYAAAPTATLHFTAPSCEPEQMTVEEFKRRIVLGHGDVSDDRVAVDRFNGIEKGVVGYPLDLLRHRVQIVDTPGLDHDRVRTARTMSYLEHAHAVIMVLDATSLLGELETRFLETQLLPRGLRNIFFVINKWNQVPESALRPSDVAREYAELEQRIRTHLTPFCVVNGEDLSAQRIFRINALAAEKARLSVPVNAELLAGSTVPAFEHALADFLVHGRRAARLGLIDVEMARLQTEIDRSIAMRQELASKSVEEIKDEIAAVEPKLDHLRGIRDRVMSYLTQQSDDLQTRIVASFEHMLDEIDAGLEDAINAFHLDETMKGSLVFRALFDWTRSDENKLSRVIEREIRPQVDALLEPALHRWQESVTQNEMRAVQLDVEKHMERYAREYEDTMKQIEDEIGSVNKSLSIKELIAGWFSDVNQPSSGVAPDFSGISLVGDFSWLVGSIVADLLLHLSGVWLPVVGLVLSAFSLLWREAMMRQQIRDKIIEGIRKGLVEARTKEGKKIRRQIATNLARLVATVSENFDIEIGVVETTLETSLAQRTERTSTAEQEVMRLTVIQNEVERQVQFIGAMAARY